MKSFFRDHSYNMVKMFLNQFATAIFGVVLALAAGKAQNPVLRNVTSVFAILFYLYLLYTMTWEIGFRDKVGSENGRLRRMPWKGALISLCANIPNLVFALFITLAHLVTFAPLNNLGGFCGMAALFLEGMYTGLLANTVGGVALNSHWWIYFLIVLPAVAVCGVAYVLGLNDVKFTSLSSVQYPESDREPKQKK